MRFMKAQLKRASDNLEGHTLFRKLFASLSREAGVNEDLYARASFLEGLLGYTPGSISKMPRPHFQEFTKALWSSQESGVLGTLRGTYGMSDKDLALLFSMKDLHIFDSLAQGAAQAMKGSGSFRGFYPEDIAMSIAAGISPLTGKAMKYGPGQNVFHYLAKNWRGRVSIAGLSRILQKEAYNRALDLVRGTRSEDINADSLDSPAFESGDGDAGSLLQDIIVNQDPQSRSDFTNIVDAIFNNGGEAMRIINNSVRSLLSSQAQEYVWQAIVNDPSLINVDSGQVGVKMRELAQEVAEISGVPYNGKSSDVSAGKTFREKVWPAFLVVMESSPVAQSLLKDHEIMEIIHDSTRRPYRSKTRNIGIRMASRVAMRHLRSRT